MSDAPASPAARLRDEPWAFDFFRAVRLLEELAPGRKGVGGDGPPAAEAVKFAAALSLAFPASSIADAEFPEDGPARLEVNFFGLTGPLGVLPQVTTQALIGRAKSDEGRAAAAWIDLFTHRFLSHFHRAWAKYRLPVRYAEAANGGSADPITAGMLALIGLGTPGMAGRFPGVPDEALLRYAPLLQERSRPAAALERLLADYFGVPVAVESFAGRRVRIDADDATRLGRPGRFDQLGRGVVAGRRVWDAAGALRVRVGPLTRAQFAGWMPDGDRLPLLAELARFVLRDGLDFEVRLILAAGEVPAATLSRTNGARVGRDCWVGRRPAGADDARFRSERLTPMGSA